MPSQENKLILWIIGFKLKEHSCRFLTAWGSEYLRKPTLSRLICSEPEVSKDFFLYCCLEKSWRDCSVLELMLTLPFQLYG